MEPGPDGIAETDINLNWYLCLFQECGERDPYTFVVGLLDTFRLHRPGIEAQSVALNFNGRDLLENPNEALRVVDAAVHGIASEHHAVVFENRDIRALVASVKSE
jgi:hypothetical protein